MSEQPNDDVTMQDENDDILLSDVISEADVDDDHLPYTGDDGDQDNDEEVDE